MNFIDGFRKELNISKNEIYKKNISRRQYESYTHNILEAPLKYVISISDEIGVNYQQIYAEYGIHPTTVSEIDKYRIKCISLISENNCQQIVKEIDYLERTSLHLKNSKYLNIWTVLRLHMYTPKLGIPSEYQHYKFSEKDLKIIESYYKKRKNLTNFLSTSDLQIFSNLVNFETSNFEPFQKIFNYVFSDTTKIKKYKPFYEHFLTCVVNFMYYSCKHENLSFADSLLKLYREIETDFPSSNVGVDIKILINLFSDLLIFFKTKNDEYYASAIVYRNVLVDTNCKDALYICEDIFDDIINNKDKNVKNKYEFFISKREY